MSKVAAAVKATLVGTQEEELAVSQQIKTNFVQHARKDESSGELFMTEEEFIDAIAPKHQDYVSIYIYHISMLSLIECTSA
jgi:solute carrier family 25 aspartate/glutamate transporter 12/13